MSHFSMIFFLIISVLKPIEYDDLFGVKDLVMIKNNFLFQQQVYDE
jgi:hypothetical protein